jgi:hypothetical protein
MAYCYTICMQLTFQAARSRGGTRRREGTFRMVRSRGIRQIHVKMSPQLVEMDEEGVYKGVWGCNARRGRPAPVLEVVAAVHEDEECDV